MKEKREDDEWCSISWAQKALGLDGREEMYSAWALETGGSKRK